jgi:hypothetical protein
MKTKRSSAVPHRALRCDKVKLLAQTFLQPWFLPQNVAISIRAVLPPWYFHKMRIYFDDWGCLVCGEGSMYGSNGMCTRCVQRIEKRLLVSLSSRHPQSVPARLEPQNFSPVKAARMLLSDLLPNRESRKRKMRLPKYRAD